MIGRTLGSYRVIESLGQGGMGTVYLAEDTQLGRKVAIKVISGAAHTDPAARARFLQEARAASALDHPNICAIHQIGETEDGAPFLVMAHYDGETLDRAGRSHEARTAFERAIALAAKLPADNPTWVAMNQDLRAQLAKCCKGKHGRVH